MNIKEINQQQWCPPCRGAIDPLFNSSGVFGLIMCESFLRWLGEGRLDTLGTLASKYGMMLKIAL